MGTPPPREEGHHDVNVPLLAQLLQFLAAHLPQAFLLLRRQFGVLNHEKCLLVLGEEGPLLEPGGLRVTTQAHRPAPGHQAFDDARRPWTSSRAN